MSCLIIAEAGVNHNGDIRLAKELVLAAKKAGADFVKFQTFKTENCILKDTVKAPYQKENTGDNESQFEMVKKLELSYSEFKELSDFSRNQNIGFLSTAFDIESINFLRTLSLAYWKVPSGEITNLPYLRMIGSLKEPIIMSTGMSTFEEIDAALKILISSGAEKSEIILLHCNTEYPTPFEDVNLNAMLGIQDYFNIDIGYSDHTLGFEVPVAAVALGAKVIEKHLTLDNTMEGPDHSASLEPEDFYKMVKAIRNTERCLGNKDKTPSKSELKNLNIARKSIVAAKGIEKGEVFTETNLTVKRPGTGISPMEWDNFIGKRAKRTYSMDDLIIE